MARTKSAHDIAPVIRGAVVRAIKILEDKAKNPRSKGKSLSELIAEGFETNPAVMLNAVARFMPREVKVDANVEHEHRHTVVEVSQITEWIAETLELPEGAGQIESNRDDSLPRPN